MAPTSDRSLTESWAKTESGASQKEANLWIASSTAASPSIARLSSTVPGADFRFHLEEPKRGTLTGSELPILPLYSWRSISGTIMDRYLAAGPSKDPVIHRGFKLTREHVAPFPPNCPIPVSVILAMPIVHHMPSNQRELLEQIQNLCRVHYGDGNDVEALENCLQNFVELLIDSETDDMRSALMVSIMRKRKPPQREMAKLLAYVGKRIDVEKEQMLSIIQILRNRDCLNRDQSERLRENFFDVFRERNNGRIRLIDIQRAVIKAKYRMPEE